MEVKRVLLDVRWPWLFSGPISVVSSLCFSVQLNLLIFLLLLSFYSLSSSSTPSSFSSTQIHALCVLYPRPSSSTTTVLIWIYYILSFVSVCWVWVCFSQSQPVFFVLFDFALVIVLQWFDFVLFLIVFRFYTSFYLYPLLLCDIDCFLAAPRPWFATSVRERVGKRYTQR